MKTALILIAVALALVLGLAMGVTLASGAGAKPFTTDAEFDVRARFPGGAFVDSGTAYRTCENGSEVRRYADGRALTFPGRTCWR
ncbi:MAG: hypothetical protein NUW01_11665 [Gemmatimonadaceae bacterium]|nr:hypothetical protein [Gemmatimonadaceae bacterium]